MFQCLIQIFLFKHVRKHIANTNLKYSFFNACHLSIVLQSWVTMVSNIAPTLSLSCQNITGEHDVCCETLVDIFKVSFISCTCDSLIAEYEVSVIFWSSDTIWDVSASSFRFWSCKLCNLCLGNLQYMAMLNIQAMMANITPIPARRIEYGNLISFFFQSNTL